VRLMFHIARWHTRTTAQLPNGSRCQSRCQICLNHEYDGMAVPCLVLHQGQHLVEQHEACQCSRPKQNCSSPSSAQLQQLPV
jgi:hypothetical protein